MEFIVYMYLKVCVWLDTQETPHRERASYFIHDDGHMIPRNDVLVVLSLPPDYKKNNNNRGIPCFKQLKQFRASQFSVF